METHGAAPGKKQKRMPSSFDSALDDVLRKLKELSASEASPILTASILAGEACALFQCWLDSAPDGDALDRVDEVRQTAIRAQERANKLLANHRNALEEFKASGGAKPFKWVDEHAKAAAGKWRDYSDERKWLLKACELLNEVVEPPTGSENSDLAPFFYTLGQTADRVDSICTMNITWILALDLATAESPCSMRFGAAASAGHTWLRQQGTEVEIDVQRVEGGTVLIPLPLIAEEDYTENDIFYDPTSTSALSTYHLLRGYLLEYRNMNEMAYKEAYKEALLACRRSPLVRKYLEEVGPEIATSIKEPTYGPNTPRPEGMSVEKFVTFLLENAVKKMRERYRDRAERYAEDKYGKDKGEGRVGLYVATPIGAAQLKAIDEWLRVLGERCGIQG